MVCKLNRTVLRVVEQKSDRVVVLVDETLPITVSYREPLSIGQTVTIVIRPEKIAISKTYTNGNQPSGWSATVLVLLRKAVANSAKLIVLVRIRAIKNKARKLSLAPCQGRWGFKLSRSKLTWFIGFLGACGNSL
jgi:hypothetical protein